MTLETLHERILWGLRKTGPTTAGHLASHLSEPFGVVLLALEKLRDAKEVRVLPGGLWALSEMGASARQG
jgi:hypothetical protein